MFSDTTNEEAHVDNNSHQEKANGTQDKTVNGKKRKAEDVVQNPQKDVPKKVKSVKSAKESHSSASKEEMDVEDAGDLNPDEEIKVTKESVVSHLTQGNL